MKFKDIVLRWVKEVNGKAQPSLTTQEKIAVTSDLQNLLGCIDLSANRMQFKDLIIKSKTVNTFDQEVTVKITFNKAGNGGLIIKEME